MPLRPVSRPSAPTPAFPNGIRTQVLPAGSTIFRIHQQNQGPIWFGPKPGDRPAHRFDATGGEYHVMYAAGSLDGAFVETVLRGKTRAKILARAFLDQRAWTELRVKRDLILVKLYDDGLLWHGTDASVSACDSYAVPREIAGSLHAEFPRADGITYRARHDNGEICYALFDRVVVDDLDAGSPALFTEHGGQIEVLMRKYGAVLDDTPRVAPP